MVALFFSIFASVFGNQGSDAMSNIRVAYTAGEAIGPELFSFFRGLGINLNTAYSRLRRGRQQSGRELEGLAADLRQLGEQRIAGARGVVGVAMPGDPFEHDGRPHGVAVARPAAGDQRRAALNLQRHLPDRQVHAAVVPDHAVLAPVGHVDAGQGAPLPGDQAAAAVDGRHLELMRGLAPRSAIRATCASDCPSRTTSGSFP